MADLGHAPAVMAADQPLKPAPQYPVGSLDHAGLATPFSTNAHEPEALLRLGRLLVVRRISITAIQIPYPLGSD
jgi:hypothetical protein